MGNSRTRKAAATRSRLLQAAFREFHRMGFKGADLDLILGDAGVTKGALYHHFAGKRGLAYAVVDEVLGPWILDRWLQPLRAAQDPIDALIELAKWGERSATPLGLALGCPLLGLSQELAGTDEGFRVRLAGIYEEWQVGLAEILEGARRQGLLVAALDPAAVAAFIVAAWQGSIGLAKARQDPRTLSSCRKGLESYLSTLRAGSAGGTVPIR